MFEYDAVELLGTDELNNHLDIMAREGWRLHTCEPKGYGSAYILVVMDRLVVDSEEAPSMDEDAGMKVT